MNQCHLTSVVMCIAVLSALGCGGDYTTSVASDEERRAVRECVTSYLAEVQQHADAGEKVMRDLVDVESFEVVKVVRMANAGKLKALIHFQGKRGKPAKRQVILVQDNDTLRVEGIL